MFDSAVLGNRRCRGYRVFAPKILTPPPLCRMGSRPIVVLANKRLPAWCRRRAFSVALAFLGNEVLPDCLDLSCIGESTAGVVGIGLREFDHIGFSTSGRRICTIMGHRRSAAHVCTLEFTRQRIEIRNIENAVV